MLLPVFRYVSVLAFFTIHFNVVGQNLSLERVSFLSSQVAESSTLLFCNGKIITHNDSGGEPELYELDTINGAVTRTVSIGNATNIDWEEIAQDDNYIYIGDFGNQSGDRKNLKIYKVAKDAYFNRSATTVNGEVIEFSYADQTSFTTNTYRTNYDAEAFVAKGDSLYIFTKNWQNFKTYVYSLSASPGIYQATRIDSMNVAGLITAATINKYNNRLILAGYSTSGTFIWEIQSANNIFLGQERIVHHLDNSENLQVEGICATSANNLLASTENNAEAASLYRIKYLINGGKIQKQETNIAVCPNPADEYLSVLSDCEYKIEILNWYGQMQLSSSADNIDISYLQEGFYWVKIYNSSGNLLKMEKLMVK